MTKAEARPSSSELRVLHSALCILSSILLAVFAGCNSFPVGFGQLDRTPESVTLTLGPDSLAGFYKYAALGSSDVMYLGQDSEYVSRLAIKFALPDSALGSVTTIELTLHPADSIPMGFVCYPCSSNWDANAASWRMADSSVQWFNPGGDYRKIQLGAGTLEGDSLVISLDRTHLETLVRECYGVIIIPADTGFAAVYSGYSQATSPRIRLTYADGGKVTLNSSDDAHLIHFDTLRLGLGTRQRPRIGSGFAFRTYLDFALVDSIPEAATITKAELSFLPQSEYRRADTLQLGVHRLTESFELKGRNARFETNPVSVLDYVVSADTDSVARIDIRSLVQFWTAHPDSDFGLILTAEPDWQRPFRLLVPHSGPNAPRLNLLYVMPPKDRFE